VLELFSLRSPPQNLYDARIHDSLDRRDAALTLLLIRSAEPLARLPDLATSLMRSPRRA
jgi:hypothetical protein